LAGPKNKLHVLSFAILSLFDKKKKLLLFILASQSIREKERESGFAEKIQVNLRSHHCSNQPLSFCSARLFFRVCIHRSTEGKKSALFHLFLWCVSR